MTPSRGFRRRIALFALATSVAVTLAGCGSGGERTTVAGGAKLVKAGQLTTCTHLPYPPFQFEQGGKVVGFDVSMIDLVAARLKVSQVIVDQPFETIKTGAVLNAGKCDIAAAGMTITDERKQNLDFSDPYFNATQALLSRKGVNATSLDDVKARKLKLGSQSSTTGEDYAHKHGVDSQSFESSDALLNGLRTGQVDVIIEDYPVVTTWLKSPDDNARFALTASLDTGERYGFAVQKGANPGLVAAVNDVIKQAKQDGTYQKIYEQWIGPMPAGGAGQ
jgi:polar amino acid transport system substrate-binding protein